MGQGLSLLYNFLQHRQPLQQLFAFQKQGRLLGYSPELSNRMNLATLPELHWNLWSNSWFYCVIFFISSKSADIFTVKRLNYHLDSNLWKDNRRVFLCFFIIFPYRIDVNVFESIQ